MCVENLIGFIDQPSTKYMDTATIASVADRLGPGCSIV